MREFRERLKGSAPTSNRSEEDQLLYESRPKGSTDQYHDRDRDQHRQGAAAAYHRKSDTAEGDEYDAGGQKYRGKDKNDHLRGSGSSAAGAFDQTMPAQNDDMRGDEGTPEQFQGQRPQHEPKASASDDLRSAKTTKTGAQEAAGKDLKVD